jgi:hypothetical protein
MSTDIRGKQPPTPTSVNNQGAKKVAESTGPTKRSKHIEVQHFYVQEKVQDKSVILNNTPTDQMRADTFTKGIVIFRTWGTQKDAVAHAIPLSKATETQAALPAIKLIRSLQLQRVQKVWSQIEGGCESIS